MKGRLPHIKPILKAILVTSSSLPSQKGVLCRAENSAFCARWDSAGAAEAGNLLEYIKNLLSDAFQVRLSHRMSITTRSLGTQWRRGGSPGPLGHHHVGDGLRNQSLQPGHGPSRQMQEIQ